jgi:hypothetical protein
MASEAIDLIVVAPLYGLSSDETSFSLTDDISFVRLDDDARQALLARSVPIGAGSRPLFGFSDITAWEYQVEAACRWKPDEAGLSPINSERIDDAVAVLRLTTTGSVKTGIRWVRGARPSGRFAGPQSGLGSMMGPPDPLGWAASPVMHLSAEDISRAREIFPRYEATKSDRQFAFVLRRFQTAYERRTDEDRLIDYWIGLEALFSAEPGIQGELTYRLSLRLARYLREALEGRRDIRKRARDSYRLRSRIVHGDPSPPDLGDTTRETEQLLREALVRWIDPTVSHDFENLDLGR